METVTLSPQEEGIQALRAGDLDVAIELLTRAAEEDWDGSAQVYLGMACSQKGLHGPARQALQAAVEQQPRNPQFRYNLGVALERGGDLEGAAAAYREALRLDPQSAPARAALLAMGRPVQAAPTAGRLLVEAKAGSPPVGAPWLNGAYFDAAVIGHDPAASLGSRAIPEMGVGEAFARRFAAFMVDEVIVILLGFFVQVFAAILIGFAVGVRGGSPSGDGVSAMVGLVGLGIAVVTDICYFAIMTCACGQTVGKLILGLRVVGPDGRNPGFWTAVLREGIGKIVSFVVFCLGYFWMLGDGEQQTWHDKIAGTHVVRA